MILTEVKKIKVALSELQRCSPVKTETFNAAKHFRCKELLPINSLDELRAYDSYIKNGSDFKADFVRNFELRLNISIIRINLFLDGISLDVRW